MSDVQADINESQSVQAALTAASESQDPLAPIATPGNDPLEVKPFAVAESATVVEPQVTGEKIASAEPTQGVTSAEVEHTGEDLKIEPEGELRTTKNPSVMDEVKAEISAKANTGAALAEQRASFKAGASQAGNAMDTMHGSVNRTWPPTFKK